MKKIVALIALAVIVLSVAAAALIPAADPGGFGGGDVVYVLRLSGTIQESGSSFPPGSGISPAFVRKRLGGGGGDGERQGGRRTPRHRRGYGSRLPGESPPSSTASPSR